MNKESINNDSTLPILYTFRRCPYAIRTRLAIELSCVNIEYREILLKDKPLSMLEASPKGTVPVLILNNHQVIDESLDIIYWSLDQYDPHELLIRKSFDAEKKLIEINDNQFKPLLDKYKYAVRFPEQTVKNYRESCMFFLENIESLLKKNKFLFDDSLGLADIAVFPFIRQFAFVDKTWFDSTKYRCLQKWLKYHLESELFQRVMINRDVWVS